MAANSSAILQTNLQLPTVKKPMVSGLWQNLIKPKMAEMVMVSFLVQMPYSFHFVSGRTKTITAFLKLANFTHCRHLTSIQFPSTTKNLNEQTKTVMSFVIEQKLTMESIRTWGGGHGMSSLFLTSQLIISYLKNENPALEHLGIAYWTDYVDLPNLR